jgi:8-oxo-dGTP diphosphatase
MPLRVTCAIILDGERVLCAQRGPHMTLPGQWEFPGGKIEAGESEEDCIVREIKEELALTMEIVERGPSAFHPYKQGQMLELIPFIGVVVGGHLQLREHAQARWCTLQGLDELDWAAADVAIVAWWRENASRICAQVANR